MPKGNKAAHSKQVRAVVEKLGDAVHEEDLTPTTIARKQKAKMQVSRRQWVGRFFFQGCTKEEIIERLAKKGISASAKELEGDLQAVKRQLTPKEVKSLTYLRNRSVSGLRQVQSVAWEIVDGNEKNPSVRLNALSKFMQAEDLVAKVQGISGEKIVIPSDNATAKLMRELREIEDNAKKEVKGNGHKKEEIVAQ